MVWPLFKEKKEKQDVIFPLRLTKTDKAFVESQALEERTSENGLIRKAIYEYQKYIKKTPIQ